MKRKKSYEKVNLLKFKSLCIFQRQVVYFLDLKQFEVLRLFLRKESHQSKHS